MDEAMTIIMLTIKESVFFMWKLTPVWYKMLLLRTHFKMYLHVNS
jgi:hypothetical protein